MCVSVVHIYSHATAAMHTNINGVDCTCVYVRIECFIEIGNVVACCHGKESAVYAFGSNSNPIFADGVACIKFESKTTAAAV